MPRAHLSKRLSDHDAIRLFAETHISQVRRRKNGEIVAVKHALYGWISPRAYYAVQKFHDALPKLIEGGFRLKQAMWSVSISVIGTDIELPIGEGLMLAMAGKIFLSLRDGNPLQAAKWAAMLALPFGDVVALWILSNEILGINAAFPSSIADIGDWLSRLTKLPIPF